LAKTGVTPIVVEHNIEIVLSLCNIVILMESGAIVSIHDQDSAEPMPERMSQYLRYSEVE